MSFQGRYDNIEQLAPGLFRARHMGMNAPVLVRTESISSADWSNALRVGHALARVRHRHILPILEAIELQSAVALVMRAPPDGVALGEVLESGGLTLEEAESLGIQILDALAVAHEHGVSHGGLCAQSVLIRELPSGVEALVHDFGIRGAELDAQVNLARDVADAAALLRDVLSSTQPGDRGVSASRREALLEVVQSALGTDRSPPTARELLVRWRQSCAGSTTGSGFTADLHDERPGSLSVPMERFVGRERSLEMIETWLASGVRLVTITGLGGVGKSRLALEVAGRQVAQFPGGAYHCVLQDLRNEFEIWSTLARVLELSIGAGDPAAQFGRALQARGRTLIVLDDSGVRIPYAHLVIDLLQRCPSAVVLCASRARLGVRGEHVRPLGPLGVDAASRLLRARLEQAGRADALRPEQLDSVVDALDGLPLALELFARQSRVMDPAELMLRLQDGLGIGGRGSGGRHSTLERVFADQWSLMAQPARQVLTQLAVFSDSFSTEDLLGVIKIPSGSSHEGLLAVLLDARLVLRHGERFRLLHNLERFLADRTETDLLLDYEGLRRRHAHWFSRLGAGERLFELSTADRACLPNILSACQWALHAQDPVLAARCGLATYWLLDQCGQALSMEGLLSHILELPGLSYRHRGRLMVCLARIALHEGDSAKARKTLETARSLAASDSSISDIDSFLGLRRRGPATSHPPDAQ